MNFLGEYKIFSFKTIKKIIIALIIILVFDFFLFPASAQAAENKKMINTTKNKNNKITLTTEIKKINNTNLIDLNNITNNNPKKNTAKTPTTVNNLPKNDWKIKKTGYYTITAYNSEKGQCDNTPCITANGFNLCKHGIEDSIAANFLAFGTKIKIPKLFGDRVFVVRDRMHKRYHNRIDVWMIKKKDAKAFGVRVAKIEILAGH